MSLITPSWFLRIGLRRFSPRLKREDKKRENKMKAFIPTSIIDLLSDYIKIDTSLSIDEKGEQRLIKSLVELWYFIYTRQIEDKDVENLKFFVKIEKKELHSIFRLKINKQDITYKRLLDMLEINGVISIHGKYKAGSFSKGYRIETDFLNTTNMTEFEVDFDKVFYNTRNRSFWLESYPKHAHLIEDIYSSSVRLDDYLKWMQDNEGMELNPVFNDGIIKRRFLTKETIYNHFNLALKLNLKNIWVKLSDQGRFYSSISNLPYTATPFLMIDGMKTRDIDISNSQPLLLTVLLKGHIEYKKDVEEGIFYEKVGASIGKTRKEFKIMAFKNIFFSKNPLKTGMTREAMASIYPGLIEDINKIKEDTILSHKLQELESDIFVKRIGKIKIKKLLRHDQVIVVESNYELIKKFLILEYKKINIDLKIKT